MRPTRAIEYVKKDEDETSALYMWDFGTKRPMSVDRMKQQCELALKLLLQRCIEGLFFLATNICDLDLETVNWPRRWIAKVGDEPLGTP